MRFQYTLISAVLVLILSACGTVNTNPAYKVKGKNFVSLFDKIDTPFFGRSVMVPNEEIMAFINECCQTKEQAISMLKNNGFKVTYFERSKENKQAMRERLAKSEDDALINASKLKDNVFFDDTYSVILYIQDGKIYRSFGYAKKRYQYYI